MRLRGYDTGALDRAYLHSATAESLRRAVAESDRMLSARLAHAVMIASLYGNPDAKLDSGNDQVHRMYLEALKAMPYFRSAIKAHGHDDVAQMVEEWRRLNSDTGSSNKGNAEDGHGS